MSVPQKFKAIGDFHEYYSGKRTAPYLTVFIGGNHEASNHLFELYYGGWVAPNIYYLGAANVIRCGPLRIAAVSGIWKGYDYRKPHFERLPYSRDDVQSIYHIRELDVRKLLQIRSQVDLGLSHDWPRSIELSGDYETLFRRKRGFREDSSTGRLGSTAAKYVLDRLRPAYWFSAHLHVQFSADIRHGEHILENGRKAGEIADGSLLENNLPEGPEHKKQKLGEGKTSIKNSDEVDLDLDSDSGTEAERKKTAVTREGRGVPISNTSGDSVTDLPKEESVSEDVRNQLPSSFKRPELSEETANAPRDIPNKVTHFLALDKCLPKRHFLHLAEFHAISDQTNVRHERPYRLQYDKEWLAISRVFANELKLGDPKAQPPPDRGDLFYGPLILQEEKWIEEHVVNANKLTVPDDFVPAAPIYNPAVPSTTVEMPPEYNNPQTARFCELIGIENKFHLTDEEREARMQAGPPPETSKGRPFGGARGGRGGRARWRGRVRLH